MHPNRLLLGYPWIWGRRLGGSPAEAEQLFGERGEGNWGTSVHFGAVLMSAVKASINLCAFIYALHAVFSGNEARYLGTLLGCIICLEEIAG